MITTAMRIFYAYPAAAIGALLLLLLATLSPAERKIDELCQKQVVANGLSQEAAKRACDRI